MNIFIHSSNLSSSLDLPLCSGFVSPCGSAKKVFLGVPGFSLAVFGGRFLGKPVPVKGFAVYVGDCAVDALVGFVEFVFKVAHGFSEGILDKVKIILERGKLTADLAERAVCSADNAVEIT